MKTLRVRDVMSTDIVTLRGNMPLDEAARTLNARHISGAPVLDGSRIVGVISLTDLAQRWTSLSNPSVTVEDVMARVIYAVRPGDPVMTAVRLMVEEDIHRTVVVTNDGSLAGMITAMDVLRALARGASVQEEYASASAAEHELHSDPAVAVQYVDLRTYDVAS
jgi:predicted transcriptional regulator